MTSRAGHLLSRRADLGRPGTALARLGAAPLGRQVRRRPRASAGGAALHRPGCDVGGQPTLVGLGINVNDCPVATAAGVARSAAHAYKPDSS
jgi:hypothetical protein